MNDTTVALQSSPLVAAINQHMQTHGGQAVRQRMVEGRMQFWVQRGDGATVSGTSLAALANSLGVPNGATMSEPKKKSDLISLKKAAQVSGYSYTTVVSHLRDGRLEVDQRRVKGARVEKGTRVSRAQVVEWAAGMRKLGGIHLPRRVKQRRAPTTPEPVNMPREALPDWPGEAKALQRMQRYLRTLQGTPLEMGVDEFVTRVLTQALDRLKA